MDPMTQVQRPFVHGRWLGQVLKWHVFSDAIIGEDDVRRIAMRDDGVGSH